MRRQIDGNSQANIIGALKIKANHYGGKLWWSRFSEQIFRIAKWSLCRG
jgi:hypothetical protein